MAADPTRARVFFALWPDAATAAALHRLARTARERLGGRVMRRDTMHLTLAFVGAIARERIPDLVAAADRVAVAPLELVVDTLGQWSNKRIAWAGPQASDATLIALTEALRRELDKVGVKLETRRFVPHVTLLRNAGCGNQRERLATPIRWRADGFVLVESRLRPSGAHYEVLARWPRAQ